MNLEKTRITGSGDGRGHAGAAFPAAQNKCFRGVRIEKTLDIHRGFYYYNNFQKPR